MRCFSEWTDLLLSAVDAALGLLGCRSGRETLRLRAVLNQPFTATHFEINFVACSRVSCPGLRFCLLLRRPLSHRPPSNYMYEGQEHSRPGSSDDKSELPKVQGTTQRTTQRTTKTRRPEETPTACM